MEWQEAAKRLRDVLQLRNYLVGIVYATEPLPDGDDSPLAVCTAIKRASDGAIINMSEQTSQCPGGRYYIGLGERAHGIEEFLVNVEHIFASYPIARAFFTQMTSPPTGLTPYVCFAPVSNMSRKPDLVIAVCNPMQASRILGLVAYDTGVPQRLSAFGAACQTGVTNPLMHQCVDVSFIDISARRRAGFEDDELMVSLPYRHFMQAVNNIERSICGTAEPERPLH